MLTHTHTLKGEVCTVKCKNKTVSSFSLKINVEKEEEEGKESKDSVVLGTAQGLPTPSASWFDLQG